MIALVQRAKSGSVEIDGEIIATIRKGLVVLVGVCREDSAADAIRLAEKTFGLRIFEDDAGKMNNSLSDVAGEVLAVSQFTLCADTARGRRPSFDYAMPPDKAEKLFSLFVELLRAKNINVVTGIFGAKMTVKIENDGPVTLILDSKKTRQK